MPIRDVVPDVDTLLALPAEELARILLDLIPRNTPNGLFLPAGVDGADTGHQYPGNRDTEVAVALAEGWGWLQVNLLVVVPPGINGNNGWRMLSRLGRAIEDGQDFEAFRAAAAFPKSILHARIADRVWLELARGNLDTAVFIAFREVEIAVREAGGYAAEDHGVTLMRRAFNPESGPLTDLAQNAGERQALSDLFAGAIGSYKNPHSHRTVALTDRTDAQEMVVLASHLLGIVDSRRPLAGGGEGMRPQ